LDLFEKIPTQTKRQGTNFLASFTKFKHRIQKLHHFESNWTSKLYDTVIPKLAKFHLVANNFSCPWSKFILKSSKNEHFAKNLEFVLRLLM